MPTPRPPKTGRSPWLSVSSRLINSHHSKCSASSPASAPRPFPVALAERENNLRSIGVQAAPIIALSRSFEDPVPSELTVEGVDLATLMFNYHHLGHL